MKAEIITIGTEILLGQIVDTNSQFLADRLALLGIDLYYTTTVGDNLERLLDTLRQARKRSELIITTGGLGPTEDDITREAVAGLLGEEPQVDAETERQLAEFFAQRGIEMPRNNVKQATVIPSAAFLRNPVGTAPGWWVEKDGGIIVVMPGPPGEMQYMWRNEVSPRLQQRAAAVILSRTLKTFGLSEGKIDEMIAPLALSPNPTLATYAKTDGIQVRITAKAPRPEAAREMIAEREAAVRSIIGEYVWGTDDETPESTVGRVLLDRGLTLAVADGFSNGRLAQVIGGAPGSGGYFRGGLITGGDEAKVSLGIDSGLVAGGDNLKVAPAMAALARAKLGADIGIGLDGYSGPEGGAEVAKVFIAIDGGPAGRPPVESYSGRPDMMKARAVYQALFNLRKFLG